MKHCIAIAKGDIDSATQILLHRQETGQSLTDKSLSISGRKSIVVDDAELKNRIIERWIAIWIEFSRQHLDLNRYFLFIRRYSYVDKNAAQREYKPMVPKFEPKKLVRYRDNKIVSLKGERYTEVKRDEEAELKKPKKQLQP